MRYLLIAAALGACVPTTNSDPLVSSYNGHTVTVEAWGIDDYQKPAAEDYALARQTCPNAQYLSTKPVNEYKVSFLFRC